MHNVCIRHLSKVKMLDTDLAGYPANNFAGYRISDQISGEIVNIGNNPNFWFRNFLSSTKPIKISDRYFTFILYLVKRS